MSKNFFLIAALFFLTVMSTACGPGKKASALSPVVAGETEVEVPLSEPEYRSDSEYWRAVQNGVSKDLSMAKKIAMQNARQELASVVQHDVKAVIENYGKNASIGFDSEKEGIYQELGRVVIDNQMNGVDLVGEKLYRLPDGSYRYHVCLQISRDALGSSLAEALSSDDRLMLEFDKARFMKIFEEEMSRYGE